MTFFPFCFFPPSFFVYASLPLPIKFSPNVIMKNKCSRSAPLEGGTSVYPRRGFLQLGARRAGEGGVCRANKTNFKGCAFLILKVCVNTVEHFRLNPSSPTAKCRTHEIALIRPSQTIHYSLPTQRTLIVIETVATHLYGTFHLSTRGTAGGEGTMHLNISSLFSIRERRSFRLITFKRSSSL